MASKSPQFFYWAPQHPLTGPFKTEAAARKAAEARAKEARTYAILLRGIALVEPSYEWSDRKHPPTPEPKARTM